MKGPGKSWNFLGYDLGGGHNDAGADAKFAKLAQIVSLYMKKSLV